MKKRTNKLLSTLLSLALLLGIFAPGFTVYAGVVDSGDCGDNVAWSLDDGGVMTISVKDATQPGEMTDYVSSSDTPWYSHLGDVTSVIVKEGVTKVGNRAFDSAINVETVSLPKGLKTIGDSAFFGIEKLKEVDLPEGLETVGDYAFKACVLLSKVTTQEGLVTIGESAFSDCAELSEVKLSEGLKTIGEYAFGACEKLTEIKLPETLEVIDMDAFNKAGLLQIDIPASVQQIKTGAFICGNMTKITVASENENFKSVDGVLYSKDGKTLLRMPAKKNGDSYINFTVPDGVEKIGEYAFTYSETLLDVYIPASVETIGTGAFEFCTQLSGVIFLDAENSKLKSLGSYCFSDCKNLTTVSLPASVTEIGISCFSGCEYLASFVVPKTVVSLPESAFFGCGNLQKIVISNTMTQIGENAFAGCDALADVYYLGKSTEADTLKTSVAAGNDKLTGATWSCIEDDVLATGKIGATDIDWTVYGSGLLKIDAAGTDKDMPDDVCPWNDWSFAITSLEIGSGVASIGARAFKYLNGVRGVVTIPDTVTMVRIEAFAYCRQLFGVVFPASVAQIPDYCFVGCDALESVEIPEGVAAVDESAFSKCISLKTVTLPSTLTTIEEMAFSGCKSLEEVDLPEGLTEIGDTAFCQCGKLRKISLPKSLTTLGDRVFTDMPGLEEILVADGCESFASEDGVLFSADKTTLICYPEGKTGASYTVPESVKAFAPDAIHHNQNLTGLILPEALGELSYCAIQRCPIENLAIPEGVVKICEGSAADFSLDAENRKTLKTVYLPAALTEVGENAFAYNDDLTDVYYGGTEEQWIVLKSMINPVGNEPLLNATVHYEAKARYTVTYDANGGDGAPEAQSELYYNPITLSETKPVHTVTVTFDALGGTVDPAEIKLDAAFVCWNTDKDGVGENFDPGAEYTKVEDVTLYAKWELPEIGELPEPTREGFYFNGWFTDPVDETAVTPAIAPEADATFYAHWSEIPKHTLTFDANGGEGAPEAIEKYDGYAIVLSDTVPTRSVTVTFDACGGKVKTASVKLDAEFTSWNADPEGGATTYLPGSEYDVNDNITLYAQWAFSAVGKLPKAEREGYVFDGWYTEEENGSKVTKDLQPETDMTVYAHWSELKTYTVSFDANGGSDAPATIDKTEGKTVKLPDAIPARSVTVSFEALSGTVEPASVKLDEKFVEWNTSSDGSGTAYAPGADFDKDEDTTLYAVWELSALGELPDAERTGYNFEGWFTEKENGDEITKDLQPDGDLTVYAHWSEIITYIVSFDANNGDGAPASIDKIGGEAVKLPETIPERSVTIYFDACGGTVDTASVKLDAKFTGWNTNKNGSGNSYAAGADFAEDGDITLYAQWELPTLEKLPAASKEGYIFKGWYNDAAGSFEITLDTVLQFDLTVYAVYEEIPEQTTSDVPPEGTTGSVPPEGTTGSVPPEGTTGSVPPEGTTGSVPPEGTTGSVPPEDTTGSVPPEGTTGSVPPEGTTGSVPPEGTTGSVPPEELTTGAIPPEPTTDPGKNIFFKLGDVNKDGKVNSTDARLALRISAKVQTADDFTSRLADANQDGKVKAKDARLILRASARIEPLPDVNVFEK